MSSLIAFSSGQLEALADAEGMTGSASSWYLVLGPLQSAPLLQPLLIPMPATATGANALHSGELKSLHLSTATRQIPKDPKANQPHAPTAVATTR